LHVNNAKSNTPVEDTMEVTETSCWEHYGSDCNWSLMLITLWKWL